MPTDALRRTVSGVFSATAGACAFESATALDLDRLNAFFDAAQKRAPWREAVVTAGSFM